MAAGFSTAVDSILAIREVVYVKSMVSLQELSDILRKNFQDAENLRQYLLNRCPKYGNDDDYADEIAIDLYDFMNMELSKYKTFLGGTFHIGIFSGWGNGSKPRGAHVSFGENTAATPDGRLQGMPLSENIGPVHGVDRKGITALFNSVTKMDHSYGLGGITINIRLSRSLFNKQSDREKIVSLIREFMRKGAFQIQINVVSSEILRKARENPD